MRTDPSCIRRTHPDSANTLSTATPAAPLRWTVRLLAVAALLAVAPALTSALTSTPALAQTQAQTQNGTDGKNAAPPAKGAPSGAAATTTGKPLETVPCLPDDNLCWLRHGVKGGRQ